MNPGRARDLVQQARRDIAAAQQIPVNDTTAATIVRNVYEAFRMLGEARLSLAGIKSTDHGTQLTELERLKIETARPLAYIENVKRVRHRINYDGYAAQVAEADDALDFAEKAFDACATAVEKEIDEA